MEAFLGTLRRLVNCYQAFEAYSATHIRPLGLTPAQFDVVATLGNTPGMSCRELGERTLITKGTLTGVLDRLEERGLLTRTPCAENRRSVTVRLTREGEATFASVFPSHVAHLQRAFSALSPQELERMNGYLERLSARFAPADDTTDTMTPKSRMIAAARRGA